MNFQPGQSLLLQDLASTSSFLSHLESELESLLRSSESELEPELEPELRSSPIRTRFRCSVPAPQLTEQLLQGPKSDHWHSAASEESGTEEFLSY